MFGHKTYPVWIGLNVFVPVLINVMQGMLIQDGLIQGVLLM